MSPKPGSVMILGCGRSGTSIFGELFESLADYGYRSEPPFAEVMAADFSRPMAFKVPHESDGYVPDPGLPFPLARLLVRAPGIKIFWIVRDPLDAICSLRVGIAQDWGHHPRPPDWHDWLNRPLLERCAHHWATLNSLGFAQVSKIATLVHFEAMIADPGAFAREICNAVGLNPSEHRATLSRWAGRVQDSNNASFVEAKTSRPYSRPDHAVRVGRWREALSKEEIAAVRPIVAEVGKSFGYRFPEE